MSPEQLEKIIKKCLDDFYRRRLEKLSTLKLKETLKKKNPYLFRAVGTQNAQEIVVAILRAFISSSDEGIFGDAFFEPIAKTVSGGVVSPSEGVDIAIENEKTYKAISVKSGPNIFNASQSKRMNDEFMTLKQRLLKLHKQFDPILGHAYGNRKTSTSNKRIYRTLCGQAFWEELTGDSEFYIKIIHAMKDYPKQHRAIYDEEWNKAVNRFTKAFLNEFSVEDGSIDWDKLLRFNSGKERYSSDNRK